MQIIFHPINSALFLYKLFFTQNKFYQNKYKNNKIYFQKKKKRLLANKIATCSLLINFIILLSLLFFDRVHLKLLKNNQIYNNVDDRFQINIFQITLMMF